MPKADLERLKSRLAGTPATEALEIALEEIQALWDELGLQADRIAREQERNSGCSTARRSPA